MKKSIILLCVISLLFSVFVSNVNASTSSRITDDEMMVLLEELNANGFSQEKIQTDILYDANGNASFLLISSSDGYVILQRGTFRFCECGEVNPFDAYMSEKKYYGGPLCYYIKNKDNDQLGKKYYSIEDDSNDTTVPYVVFSENNDDLYTSSSGQRGATTVYNEYYLSNYESLISRKAFGYNDDNTCSAVASGIALNYIAAKHNIAIVPNQYISETMNSGNFNNAVTLASIYPNAHSLHRYIVEHCHMNAVSYADTIAIPINREYSFDCIAPTLGFSDNYRYNLNVSWTLFPLASTIRNHIINNRPVLITTTIAGDISLHTMCVYGFRETSNGSQILVHKGWSSNNEPVNGIPNGYRQSDFWCNESLATYGHYFSFENPLQQYTDIPYYTDWSYRGILYVVHAGLMSGTTHTTFAPNHNVTRAMCVTVLYRMENQPIVQFTNMYSDVHESDYYANAVIWASENNIVNGVGGGLFNPSGNITREQMATIFYRYANYKGRDTSARADLTVFPDHNQISEYARTAMSWAIAEGIITGTIINGVACIAPQNNMTRAHIATILCRYCN